VPQPCQLAKPVQALGAMALFPKFRFDILRQGSISPLTACRALRLSVTMSASSLLGSGPLGSPRNAWRCSHERGLLVSFSPNGEDARGGRSSLSPKPLDAAVTYP